MRTFLISAFLVSLAAAVEISGSVPVTTPSPCAGDSGAGGGAANRVVRACIGSPSHPTVVDPVAIVHPSGQVYAFEIPDSTDGINAVVGPVVARVPLPPTPDLPATPALPVAPVLAAAAALAAAGLPSIPPTPDLPSPPAPPTLPSAASHSAAASSVHSALAPVHSGLAPVASAAAPIKAAVIAAHPKKMIKKLRL